MKLSQATAKSRDISVEFDGGQTLAVTYRPLTYTVNEMDKIREDGENTNRIIETAKRLIVRWDLTDDDEVPIPLDHPLVESEGGDLEPAPDDPLRDIPTHIFGEIIKAVSEDQAPSPEASRRSRGR